MAVRIGRFHIPDLPHGAAPPPSQDSFDLRLAPFSMSQSLNANFSQSKQARVAGVEAEKLKYNVEAGQATTGYSEVAMPHIIQKVLAEFIGTFFLVLAGCGSILVDVTHGGDIAHVAIATSFGLAVMIMVYTIGHVSGAHLNPAVTIGFASTFRFPLFEVPAYLIAQVGGSLLASIALRVILHDPKMIGMAVNQPSDGDLQSFVVEVVITFVLMFVISGVASDSRAVGQMAGFTIGTTIALNGIFAGPLSGASMNPARSIGPAIVARNFKSLHVYVGGPILGALTGAWVYNALRAPEGAQQKPWN